MCECTKCIHHRKDGRCAVGLKMTCERRMRKLGLKVGYWDRPKPKHMVWGTLEVSE